MARQLDELALKLRVLEGRALTVKATPVFAAATVPNPAPTPSTTLVVADIGIGEHLYGTGGGTFTIASGIYSTPQNGTIILEGQLDCRAEYWDNFVSAPRREVWTDAGGPGSNPHFELPSNLQRVTVSNRSNPLAITTGTYTCSWQATFTGGNRLHVFGGWLRVTVTFP